METNLSNDRQFIGRIYTEVKDTVYAIFRQTGIPEETCEDMVQDVFIKLMNVDILRPEQMKGLVITIAYRMRIDYFRHRFYVNKMFAEDTYGTLMECGYVDHDLECAEIKQAEMQVVNSMSELDGKTYRLCRFEDKSSSEIAMELNLSDRAVESRLYRTRKMVRDYMRGVVNG